MKKITLLFLLLITFFADAQNGAHTIASVVRRAFVSADETQLLTMSGTEIVLWDNITHQPIWSKKMVDLGLGNEILYEFEVGVDPFFKYMAITNKRSYRKLINLSTFQTSSWGYYTYNFVKDGRIAVMDYDYSKKNSHKAYLLNLDTGNKELIAEKIGDIQVVDHGNIVRIIYHNKTVNDYNYDKSKAYILATKSLTKYDKATMERNDKSLNSAEYLVNYSYYDKSIITSDKTGKKLAEFSVHNKPNVADSNLTYMFYLSEKNPHAYFLEQNFKDPFKKVSYVYVYNITDGSVIKKIELHDTSDKANLIAKQELNKQEQIDAEKKRIYNLPENVLKRRLSNFYGKYVYNNTTKGIYYVELNMPLYTGDLVKMKALHNDKKNEMEVYEKLTALEDNTLYNILNGYKSCTICGGKGFFESSGQRTVADYEYTTGKKLVETTYNKSGCSHCGGCGLMPQ